MRPTRRSPCATSIGRSSTVSSNPARIAVVGDKASSGFGWLLRFKDFDGALYSVHTNPSSISAIEALGITNHRRVTDVPRPLDYVLVNTPRRTAVDVFTQCIEAEVGGVAYFTSGFAETDAEGCAMQEEIARLARESGVVLFGPNCMGVYNPARNLPSSAGMPLGEAGPVAMLSQSGTHSGFFARALFAWHGLRERRGASFGNAAALDAADLVEYLGDDDHVSVLAAYLEGIGQADAGDHERFTRGLSRVAAKKPAIIWKGGATGDGARVTADHTGSAPVTPEDWARILVTTGAIGVDSMEELVDTTANDRQARSPSRSASGSAGPHRRAGPSHHRHLRPSRPERPGPHAGVAGRARHVLRSDRRQLP